MQVTVVLEPGAAATVTTQSAERVYRSLGHTSNVVATLTVAAGADLAFIPQETILFSGARLARTITADIACDGRLLLAEIIVFGRAAMGEILGEGTLRDRWRIRRDGGLVYADDVQLDGPIGDRLKRKAVGDGAGAAATVLLVAPDAVDRVDHLRAELDGSLCRVAASTWNGLLSVRALGEPTAVRRAVTIALGSMLRRTLPRVWST
jgi:urease accessory protein